MKTAKRAIVAAVLFCLGCSITITTIGGCLSMTRGAKPTTAPVVANTVAAPIKAAIAANELTGQAIARATTRAVSEPQKADLRQATAGANTVRVKLSEAAAAATDMEDRIAAVINDYEGQLATAREATATANQRTAIEKGKKEAAEQERDAAKEKYDSALFGGLFWDIVGWITGIGALLGIAALALNARTDFFVKVWEVGVSVVVGLVMTVTTPLRWALAKWKERKAAAMAADVQVVRLNSI